MRELLAARVLTHPIPGNWNVLADYFTPFLLEREPLTLPGWLLLLHEPPLTSFLQPGLEDMAAGNGTAVTEFVLLRFSGFGSPRGPLFWGAVCIYLVTLLGNSLVTLLTLADPVLHSPRTSSFTTSPWWKSSAPQLSCLGCGLTSLPPAPPPHLPAASPSCISLPSLASLNAVCLPPWPMTATLPSVGHCILPP